MAGSSALHSGCRASPTWRHATSSNYSYVAACTPTRAKLPPLVVPTKLQREGGRVHAPSARPSVAVAVAVAADALRLRCLQLASKRRRRRADGDWLVHCCAVLCWPMLRGSAWQCNGTDQDRAAAVSVPVRSVSTALSQNARRGSPSVRACATRPVVDRPSAQRSAASLPASPDGVLSVCSSLLCLLPPTRTRCHGVCQDSGLGGCLPRLGEGGMAWRAEPFSTCR